jgi:ureidoacrylate peracid hydrolase
MKSNWGKDGKTMKSIKGRLVYDTLEELVNPKHTAVVAVDIQNDFCHPDGHFARHGKDVTPIAAKVPTMVSFVTKSQTLGLRIIFVRQCTLPDGRSDSPAWLRFKTRDGKTPDYTLPHTWGWELVDGMVVRPQDWVVEKYRPDAFLHTCLDQMLRANGIEPVVILGTTTEGCVESTIRSASYHDYYVVVVRDAVASPNPILHEGSMRLFEARYPLATSQEILAAFAKGTGRSA